MKTKENLIRTPLQVVKDYCTIFTKKDITFKYVCQSVKRNILKSQITRFHEFFQSFPEESKVAFVNLIKEWTDNTLEFDEMDAVSSYSALVFSTIILFKNTMGNVELKLKIKNLGKNKYEISLIPYTDLVTLPPTKEFVTAVKTKDGYFLKPTKTQQNIT